MAELARILDPATLARVRALELGARRVVDGYLAGMHRSPQHGFAVEFAQHREYAPGDDIRHIDWKVFGRTERFHLKQYEQETNFTAWLLVDSSESMGYGSGGRTKYETACTAAAALAYLIVQQSDAVGLATFDAQVRGFLRPSGQATHLRDVAGVLCDGPGRETTRSGAVLHELAERLTRRGLVLVFSDLFDDVPELLAGLKHLRHQRHEVIVFHVLDAAELDFPFRDPTLFRGLEAEPELLSDPDSVRQGYLAELGRFLDEIQRGCRVQQIDYVRLRTDANLGLALASYLAKRAGRSR